MKSIKTFAAVIALTASFGSFAAQSVSATASTMDGAEAKIAAQAQAAGASSYTITEAFTGNRVHMTAELNKKNRHHRRKSACGRFFCFCAFTIRKTLRPTPPLLLKKMWCLSRFSSLLLATKLTRWQAK